jgi:hypothetical protein
LSPKMWIRLLGGQVTQKARWGKKCSNCTKYLHISMCAKNKPFGDNGSLTPSFSANSKGRPLGFCFLTFESSKLWSPNSIWWVAMSSLSPNLAAQSYFGFQVPYITTHYSFLVSWKLEPWWHHMVVAFNVSCGLRTWFS